MSETRYRPEELANFAEALFAAAGLDAGKARVVADLLVEADLLGHTTHGLALAAPYLGDVEKGGMVATGEPGVVRDKGACLTWDGRRLPGVWLAARAVDEAVGRAERLGTGTVVVRNSHHIACLAAFLTRATDRGMMVILASSDPSVASVAPFGGTRAVFTPNPIAVGIPTGGDPVLVDVSTSVTTNGMSGRLSAEGRRFDHPWLLDAEGGPTDDPAVLFAEPPGTILPVGGLDHGHKGYGLTLMVEALTQGLGGFGRAEAPTAWGASFVVQALDPEAFAGLADFTRETAHVARLCKESPPRPGVEAVRLPGEAALARKRRALAEGVALYPGVMPALEPWARRLGVEPPRQTRG
jgi:LDH2 family malate/lactate/ureidoglycolate dehydrogenase